MKKKITLCLWVSLLVLNLIVPMSHQAQASSSEFDPNYGLDSNLMNLFKGGYVEGVHDPGAPLPTLSNWSGNQRFSFDEESAYLAPDYGKWRFPMDTSPIVGSDGTIYGITDELSSDRDDSIVALNPDGTLKWEYEASYQYLKYNGAPAIGADGTLYINGQSKYQKFTMALNPDGTEKWLKDLDYEYSSTIGNPSIGKDGNIYVMTSKGIVKLSADNGKILNEYLIRSSEYFHKDFGLPIANDGTIYTLIWNSNDQYYLKAFNPDLTLKWSRELEFRHDEKIITNPYAPILGPDKTIYIVYYYKNYYGIHDKELLAIDANGNLKFNLTFNSYPVSRPVLNNGVMYISLYNGDLYAYDVHNQTYLWQINVGGSARSSLTIDNDGDLILYTFDTKEMYGIDPETGDIRWAKKIGRTYTNYHGYGVIDNHGNMYIRNDGLVALGKIQLPSNQADITDHIMSLVYDGGTQVILETKTDYPEDFQEIEYQTSTDGINFRNVTVSQAAQENQIVISNLDPDTGYFIRSVYTNTDGREMVYQRYLLRPDKFSGEITLPGEENVETPVAISDLNLSVGRTTLHPGESTTFSVQAIFEDLTEEDVTASATIVSSDPEILEVGTDNTLNALNFGTATITATYEGYEASITISVNPTVESISIELEKNEIQVGESISFTVNSHLSNGEIEDVTNSGDISISAVDGLTIDKLSGTIQGNMKGQYTIKVYGPNNLEAQAVLTVVDPVILENVKIIGTKSPIDLDESLQLEAKAIYSDGTEEIIPVQDLAWSSNNGSVASITATGLVSGLSVGETAIKVQYQGFTDTVFIEVADLTPELENIQINMDDTSLIVGQSADLSVTATYSNGVKDVTFESEITVSDITLASYENGKLTANAAGTATITATFNDGVNAPLQASLDIEIVEDEITNVQVKDGRYPNQKLITWEGSDTYVNVEVVKVDADKVVYEDKTRYGFAYVRLFEPGTFDVKLNGNAKASFVIEADEDSAKEPVNTEITNVQIADGRFPNQKVITWDGGDGEVQVVVTKDGVIAYNDETRYSRAYVRVNESGEYTVKLDGTEVGTFTIEGEEPSTTPEQEEITNVEIKDGRFPGQKVISWQGGGETVEVEILKDGEIVYMDKTRYDQAYIRMYESGTYTVKLDGTEVGTFTIEGEEPSTTPEQEEITNVEINDGRFPGQKVISWQGGGDTVKVEILMGDQVVFNDETRYSRAYVRVNDSGEYTVKLDGTEVGTFTIEGEEPSTTPEQEEITNVEISDGRFSGQKVISWQGGGETVEVEILKDGEVVFSDETRYTRVYIRSTESGTYTVLLNGTERGTFTLDLGESGETDTSSEVTNVQVTDGRLANQKVIRWDGGPDEANVKVVSQDSGDVIYETVTRYKKVYVIIEQDGAYDVQIEGQTYHSFSIPLDTDTSN